MAASMTSPQRSVFLDKMSFVQKIATLTKATSDDEDPIPGYLYQEINGLTFESGSYCHDVLDYFVDRLNDSSPRVKWKVLNLMKYLVENGHPHFRQGLRKTSQGIKEASNFGGPPDPLLGNTPYQNVRKLAKDLIEVLFDVEDDSEQVILPEPVANAASTACITGMGNEQLGSPSKTKMQGFGNTPIKQNKSIGETIVDGLKGFADKISDPQVKKPANQSMINADRYFGNYEPVTLESASRNPSSLRSNSQPLSNRPKGHKKGIAGGGWDDEPEDADDVKLSSGGISSDNSTDLSERLNTVSVLDWSQEQSLIDEHIMNQQRQIPSRNNINSFIKRCCSLNCDKVVELLNDSLSSENVNCVMHSLIMLEQLLRTDLVVVDNVAQLCHASLLHLHANEHQQPVQMKARKLIRILERISGQADLFREALPTSASGDHVRPL
ncbi:AP-4 complex accessory subunit tepsin-like [Tubulanus polymorphus]|uniref:AP-4 complex accessory subunit tepsin-like n=1 Tax=Tubulanus polymorphus TaxID=672921 RepID=UPI003DA3A9C2